ncbi:MAG TPA: hypothetical protein DDZ89_18410 [Clostridiales bacterium]|nr:hypothetical protein [Clostridiales bacterium]
MKRFISTLLLVAISAILFVSCAPKDKIEQIPVDFLEENRNLTMPYAPIFNEYTDVYKSTAIVKGTIHKMQEYASYFLTTMMFLKNILNLMKTLIKGRINPKADMVKITHPMVLTDNGPV